MWLLLFENEKQNEAYGEESVIFPEHFRCTQHCNNAGADWYSIGPCFPTFSHWGKQRKLGNLSQHTGASRWDCYCPQKTAKEPSLLCRPCPGTWQAEDIISEPTCLRTGLGSSTRLEKSAVVGALRCGTVVNTKRSYKS